MQVAQQSKELLTLEGTAAVEVEPLHPCVNLQGRSSAAWRWLMGTTQVQAACLELLLLLPLLPLVVVLLRAASPARSVMQ